MWEDLFLPLKFYVRYFLYEIKEKTKTKYISWISIKIHIRPK